MFAALLQANGETRIGLVDLDDSVRKTIIDAIVAVLKKTGESLASPRF